MYFEKSKAHRKNCYPEDPDYEQARTNNNLNDPKFPSIIVFCRHTKDVINALRWARENNESFRIRSGRHNYENYSLLNEGLVSYIKDWPTAYYGRNL